MAFSRMPFQMSSLRWLLGPDADLHRVRTAFLLFHMKPFKCFPVLVSGRGDGGRARKDGVSGVSVAVLAMRGAYAYHLCL